jgi:sugar lactone lactonase YvrE
MKINLKKVFAKFVFYIFAFVLIVPGLTPSAFAALSDGMSATNGLGHISDGSMVYDEVLANDPLGSRGFDFLGGGAVAIDTTGHRMFVADLYNGRVLVFNLNDSNVLVEYQADNVLGESSFTTRTIAPANQNIIREPTGLAYNNNTLYVADSWLNRVLVFDVTTITNGENAVKVLGQADFDGASAATTRTGMDGPASLSIGSGNKLYVADRNNNRVLTFDITEIINGEEASSVLGQADFVSKVQTTTQSGMWSPTNIFWDSNNLYVSDSGNNRVLVFDVTAIDPNGEPAQYVLGQPDFTTSFGSSSQAKLATPAGLTVNSDKLFVADYQNNRVVLFDVRANGSDDLTLCGETTNGVTTGMNASCVLGQEDFVSTETVTDIDGLIEPDGLAYNTSTNKLFVADTKNHRVMIFDVADISNGEDAVNLAGQLSGMAPTYTKAGANDGPTSKGFNDPADVVLDTVHHRLFVSDSENDRVVVFLLDGTNALTDRTADFALGQLDANARIVASAVTANKMNDPQGLAYDSVRDLLYVVDRANSRIMVFNTTVVTGNEDAIYFIGQPNDTTGSPGTTQSKLFDPTGIHYFNDRLYVLDAMNNRVLIFDVRPNGSDDLVLCGETTNGIATGMNASCVLGQANFTSGGSGTTASTLKINGSSGLAHDGTNSLYVADNYNNRVVVYDLTEIANGEAAVNVLGQEDFVSSTPALDQSSLAGPAGFAYDSANNNLFVADLSNDRIMVFDVEAITDGENAINVIGQSDFVTNNMSLSASDMYFPYGMDFLASSNTLYVADTFYNRILAFEVTPNSAPTVTNPVVGVPTDGSGTYTIATTLDDANDDSLTVRIEYSYDGGSTWKIPYLTSVSPSAGNPDLTFPNAYTITKHPYSFSGNDHDNLPGAPPEVTGLLIAKQGSNISATNPNHNITNLFTTSFVNFNLGLAHLNDTYTTVYIDPALAADIGNFDTFMDTQIGGGNWTVDFFDTDVFTYAAESYTYDAPVGPTVITSYQEGTPAINVSNPSLDYFMTRHPYSLDGNDYDDSPLDETAGLALIFNNSGDIAQDFQMSDENDKNIGGTVSFGFTNMSLALANNGVKYSSFYVDATRFPDSATFETYIDARGLGNWTIDHWTANVFVMNFETTEFGYTAPVGPTVLTTLQPLPTTPAIRKGIPDGYYIGTDPATKVLTSSGPNAISAVWDTTSVFNFGGSLSNTHLANYKIRVTADDGVAKSTPTTSVLAFPIDNLAPSGGLDEFEAGTTTTTTIPVEWGDVTELNFGHYEIWYDTEEGITRAVDESEWDNDDDNNLLTLTETYTEIEGLASNTTYYLKMWAIDTFGNVLASSEISAATQAEPEPEPDPEPEPEPAAPTGGGSPVFMIAPIPPSAPTIPATTEEELEVVETPTETPVETPEEPTPTTITSEEVISEVNQVTQGIEEQGRGLIEETVQIVDQIVRVPYVAPVVEESIEEEEEVVEDEEPRSKIVNLDIENSTITIEDEVVELKMETVEAASLGDFSELVSEIEETTKPQTISETTLDSDGDGIFDAAEKYVYGTDPFEKDSDGDGRSDGQEILMDNTEPSEKDEVQSPSEPSSSSGSGTVFTSSKPLITGKAKAGGKVNIYLLDKEGNKKLYAETEADQNNNFAVAGLNEVEDGEYKILIEDEEGNLSEETELKIDKKEKRVEKVEFKYPEPETLKEPAKSPVVIEEGRAKLTGNIEFKKDKIKDKKYAQLYFVWKSAVFTSTILADVSSGDFEVISPEILDEGDHEVTIYLADKNVRDEIAKVQFTVDKKVEKSTKLNMLVVILAFIVAFAGFGFYTFKPKNINPTSL